MSFNQIYVISFMSAHNDQHIMI